MRDAKVRGLMMGLPTSMAPVAGFGLRQDDHRRSSKVFWK